jgi:undecaprenyl diphosphate synthase
MTSASEKISAPIEDEGVYSSTELSLIQQNKVPQHVAIIMDGNRRWARQKGLPPMMGHWEGAETLADIVKAAANLGVATLTVFSFSTENKSREASEVESLMEIFELYLNKKRASMVESGVRLDAIGDLTALPQKVQDAFAETKQATQHCNKINLVLAMNYGGRDEIRRAIGKLLDLYEQKQFKKSDLTEDLISEQLDTFPFGDPDLLIRTSGELRVSNFLLWQISYSEIYKTDVLWPDFRPKHFLEAIIEYQSRERRKGGNSC